MMDITLQNILTAGAVVVAIITLLWRVVDSLIKKNEESKERTINRELKAKEKQLDRELEHNKELERQKVDLSKQVEKEKARHIQTLINGIKEEIGKLDSKLESVHTSYIELNTKYTANEDRCDRVMDEVQEFYKLTKSRFEVLEKQVGNQGDDLGKFKSEFIQITDDLIIIKDAASKIRKKG